MFENYLERLNTVQEKEAELGVKKLKLNKQSTEIKELRQQIIGLQQSISDLKEVNQIYEKKYYKTKKEADQFVLNKKKKNYPSQSNTPSKQAAGGKGD